jgi:hypothetical protein
VRFLIASAEPWWFHHIIVMTPRRMMPRRIRLGSMVKAWRVSVRLARDDGAPLSDESIAELTELLADDRAIVDRVDVGGVLVRVSVDATSEWGARSAAESKLRGAADTVWKALGLPPFTITFVEIAPDADR